MLFLWRCIEKKGVPRYSWFHLMEHRGRYPAVSASLSLRTYHVITPPSRRAREIRRAFLWWLSAPSALHRKVKGCTTLYRALLGIMPAAAARLSFHT